MAQAAGLPEELVSKAKQSRSEKKARKAMSKLGQYVMWCAHVTQDARTRFGHLRLEGPAFSPLGGGGR